MIRAVIFDMGGVLLRTEDRTPRTKLAAEHGMTYEEMETIVFGSESARQGSVGAITEDEHWQNMAQHFHLQPEDAQKFRDAFFGGDRMDNRLLAYIRGLHQTVKTGFLSNAFSNTRKLIIEANQLSDCFDTVLISSEVGLAKPDPAIFRLILSEMEVQPEEAVFVDDFSANVEAARQMGIHGVLFKNTDQAIREIQELLQG